MDRAVPPVARRRQLGPTQHLHGPGTQERQGQHVVEPPHLDPVGQDVFLEVAGDRLPLAFADLQPEAVLVGQHHDVREDAPLGIGEEAIGPLAGSEALTSQVT